MPQGAVISGYASASITICSFVKVDSANPFNVVLCAANTDNPIGVSQESAYQPPIPQLSGTQYAADTTSPSLKIYSVGSECLLQIGSGGCTANDGLTSDASGHGVTASAGQIVGAIAKDTRASGELCRVLVTSPHPLT